MINLVGSAALLRQPTVILALDIVLKATVVCLMSFVIHLALGRRRVLVRSVLWNGCLIGLLALPLVVLSFPRLRIACLPADRVRTAVPPTIVLQEPSTPVEVSHARLAKALPLVVEPPLELERKARPWSLDPLVVVVCLYAAGVACLSLRLATALWAVARLRRSAVPVEEGAWTVALTNWRSRIGITREVRLGRSARVSVPLVVGSFRPMILIPESLVEAATPQAIDAILLHELSHVRRGDYVWNLILRLMQIIYWPHPFAWLVGRTVVAVREQACDDLCVFWMEDAMSYRTTLLDVAAGLVRRPREALGLAMARSSKLGRRIKDIDSSKGAARCLLHAPARLLIVALIMGAAGVLGSVRLARTASAQAAEAPKPKPATVPKDVEAKPTPVKAPESKVDTAPADPNGRRVRELKFEVVKIDRGDMDAKSTGEAVLEFAETEEIYSKIPGTVVREGLAGVGDRVKKGQVLATIDPLEQDSERQRVNFSAAQAQASVRQAEAASKVASAALEGAEAKVAQAQAEVEEATAVVQYQKKVEGRSKILLEKQQISHEEFDEVSEKRRAAEGSLAVETAKLRVVKTDVTQAQAQVAAAEAAVKTAWTGAGSQSDMASRIQDQLKLTKLTTPFDGIVTQRTVSAGRAVRPGGEGRPLFVVARNDQIRVITHVPSAEGLRIETGAPVTLRLYDRPSLSIQSTVSRVGYEINPGAGNLRVEFVVPNPDGKLRPGMRGEANILLEPHRNVLRIPARAIVQISGSRQCYRVEGGKIFRQLVKLNERVMDQAGNVELLRGLNEGDSVLVIAHDDAYGGYPSLNQIVIRPGQSIETLHVSIPEGLQ